MVKMQLLCSANVIELFFCKQYFLQALTLPKVVLSIITTKFQNQFRKASLSLSVAVDLPNTKSFGSSDFLDFLTPSKPKEVDDKQCKE